MKTSEIAANLKPELIESFKRAVEIGKWPDGNVLTSEQREICLQAVIAYEFHNLPEDQRTGYVPPKNSACAHTDETPLKWKHDQD